MMESERERPWWLLAPNRLSAAWWLVSLGPLLCIDYATGLYIQFPLVYVIPVSLAAYYSGRMPALILAVVVPMAHLAFTLLEPQPVALFTLLGTALFRASVVFVMALWFARLSDHERALREEVRTLKGLLPICSFCKNIRNDSGDWERLEAFISKRSQTEFSHGICPSCKKIHYPSLAGQPE